jgi:hypothetical protein
MTTRQNNKNKNTVRIKQMSKETHAKHEEHEIAKKLREHNDAIRKKVVGITEPQHARSSADFRPSAVRLKIKTPTAPEHVVCPLINHWSRALNSGMSLAGVDPSELKIPLPDTSDGFTMQSSLPLTNTGQVDLESFGTTSNWTDAIFWFYPDGAKDNGRGFQPTSVTGAAGGGQAFIGANVSAEETNVFSTPGVWAYCTSAGATGAYFAPPQPGTNVNFGPFQGIDVDAYDVVNVPERPIDFNNRTVKFTVEVSVISKVVNTEGGVRFVCPSYWPGSSVLGGSSRLMSQTRRDPTYVDYNFGTRRKVVFTYVPDAKSLRFGDMSTGGGIQNLSLFDSRCMMHIYGMDADTKLLVRYVWSQEYRGTTVNALATHSRMTPDVVHLSNALQHMSNYPVDGKPVSLSEHVAAQKVFAQPAACNLAQARGVNMDDVKEVAKHAPSVLSDLAGIGGLIAGFL